MKIVTTGGGGFIGRHMLSALCEEGHNVTNISKSGVSHTPNARFQKLDLLRSRDAFDGFFADIAPDVLVLLAWETEHGKFWHAPSNAAWCSSSIDIADSFLRAGGKRIVAAGTCVEYDSPNEGPCHAEETPLHPTFPYSISKDALRRVLEWMTQSYDASFAWGRVFLAFGPGEPTGRLVPSIINSILAGNPAKCSSGRQVRDFAHAKDYGRAFAKLAVSSFSGSVNMGAGVPVTIATVAKYIAANLGREDLLQLGALEDRPNEPQNLWGDPAVLRDTIKFKPKYSLESGLDDAISFWKSEREKILT